MTLEAAARAALTEPGILRVHFQPIVDLSRGVLAGYEVLSRFAGPPEASPDRWFAAAHAAGFGPELEARALEAALRTRHALPPNVFLTVNLSPAAAISEPVQKILARCDDLRGVILELTEQQQVEDYAALKQALSVPRERGAMVAVDDAGAGFASLQHITQLRPDLVKVDRALVGGVDVDPTRSAVVETLGIFASQLDAWLLAEGVETAGEVGRLMSLGVPLAQGYFLGRPSPAMADIDVRAVEIHQRVGVAKRVGGEMAGLSTPAVTVRGPATDAALWRAVDACSAGEAVVVVDEFDRPVELVTAVAGGVRRSAPLRTTAGDRPVDVVRRALARPELERFDPLASCDERGRLIGVIGIERVIEQLARALEGERFGERRFAAA